MERFIAVLLEHCGGDLPLWLAPVQVKVLPISDKYSDWAHEVAKRLKKYDIRAELDERGEKIGRKIRDTELAKIPYMLIVGEKETADGTVSVRRHGEGDKGAMAVDLFAAEMKIAIDTQMLGAKPADIA
jgi:threonyl-tRNA synthetase